MAQILLLIIVFVSHLVFSCALQLQDRGKDETHSAIKNGKPVNPCDKYPFQVALKPGCGGALIMDRTVLTAAHCLWNDTTNKPMETTTLNIGAFVNPYPSEDVRGFYIMPGCNTTGQQLIGDVKVDERFNPNVTQFEYDFGLVILKERPKPNRFVGLICLPPPDYPYKPGTNATVIGWGLTYKLMRNDTVQWQDSNVLLEADVQVMSAAECMVIAKNTTTTFCTFNPDYNACGGDSGGPLFVTEKLLDGSSLQVVIGSISGGRPCNYTKPSARIFARTTINLEWIRQNMVGKEDDKCKQLNQK